MARSTPYMILTSKFKYSKVDKTITVGINK